MRSEEAGFRASAATDDARLRVLVFQPALPHYRTPFFAALARRVARLRVVYGRPNRRAALHSAETVGFEAEAVAHRRIGPFLWMPALGARRDPREWDVVVFSWNLRYWHLPAALRRCRRRGIASAVWGHGTSPGDRSLERRLRYAIARRADAVITYGERGRAAAVEHGLDAARVFAAPNALDQSEVRRLRAEYDAEPGRLAAFRAEQGLGGGPIALFVSRLVQASDFDELLAAWGRVEPQVRDAWLVVIGDGPARAAIEGRCSALRLSRVRFLGAIYEEAALAPWFLSAACLAMPRRVGLSLNHAFAYGLPLVSFDTPTQHGPEFEHAVHGQTALLAPDRDPNGLASALTSMLTDASRQKQLSVNARACAEKLTLEPMVAGFTRALEAARAHVRKGPRVTI